MLLTLLPGSHLFLSGFGNRVWVNPSQQKGGYIQPSYFSSHGRNDWGGGGGGGGGSGGGGGGRRDHVKSSEFSFSTQNRFASLDTSKSFVDRGGRGGTAAEEDDSKKLCVASLFICATMPDFPSYALTGLMVKQGDDPDGHGCLGEFGAVGLLLLFHRQSIFIRSLPR